jgi:two-component system, OmpR family, sensor histidine kinase SenX3
MSAPRLSWKPIVAIVLLLIALAALQYRWIGEVSRLERDRLQDALRDATRRFADDFDREISRLAVTFAVADRDALEAAWQRWQEGSAEPGILAQMLVWTPGRRSLEAWDPVTRSLQPARWPDGLERPVQRLVQSDLRRPPRERVAFGGPLPAAAIVAWPPAVILPLGRPGASRPLVPRRRNDRERLAADDDLARVLLRLDPEALTAELLPRLADAHFASVARVPVELAVLAPGAGDGRPRTLFATGERAPRPADPGALRQPLFQIRFFPELRPLYAERVAGADRPMLPRERLPRQAQPDPASAERAGWLLVAAPRAGSLDAAVLRLRWRNLALSAGILALLGTSLALVLAAARREQELARRQLALVAGITHELHTPLAALQAAGQNLEDGVVADPQRVREYGSLVRREGGRLQRLVDQTLALAGMRDGAGALRRERVDLGAALQRAVAESASVAPAPAVAVEVVTDPGPAPPSPTPRRPSASWSTSWPTPASTETDGCGPRSATAAVTV